MECPTSVHILRRFLKLVDLFSSQTLTRFRFALTSHLSFQQRKTRIKRTINFRKNCFTKIDNTIVFSAMFDPESVMILYDQKANSRFETSKKTRKYEHEPHHLHRSFRMTLVERKLRIDDYFSVWLRNWAQLTNETTKTCKCVIRALFLFSTCS